MTLSPKERSRRLNIAVDQLSDKFGLERLRTSTTALAQESDRHVPGQDQTRQNLQAPDNTDTMIGNILERFVNVTTHADSAQNFSKFINDVESGQSIDQRSSEWTDEQKNRFNSIMTIIADDDETLKLRETIPEDNPLRKVFISKSRQVGSSPGVPMLQNVAGTEAENSCVNISIICSKTPEISLANSNVNACTIFLNGIRSIDMSKAVPYLEVNFEIPLAGTGTTDEEGQQKLLAPSIYKFLLGGSHVADGSPLSKLVNANRISDKILGREANVATGIEAVQPAPAFSRAGMEMFTSPQTLVNGNESYDENNRLNSVLDKFRPYMSLKEFSSNVGTNGFGTMSYSSSKLSLVLHDKSRLAEIAPFIRADLYGRTRVEVEFGWIHPDGEALIQQTPNHFSNIINGMRKKERFQIIKSSMAFNDSGEVTIELDLVTLGTMETRYDLAGSQEEITALQTLAAVQDRVDALIQTSNARELATRASNGERSPHPIAGIQVINAVSDGFESGFRLTGEQQKMFREFINGHAGGPEMAKLRTELQKLYSARSGATAVGVTVADAQGKIREGIKDTLKRIVTFIDQFDNPDSTQTTVNGKRDPFLLDRSNPSDSIHSSRRAGTTRILAPAEGQPQARRRINAEAPSPDINGRSASLATILTSFIGVPLAAAGKKNKSWGEVQFVFYTFNGSAGFARYKNISSFEVDLNYFYDRYEKLRLENLSRSGNLTLLKFWNFLNQEIIDDIAAPSYELWDSKGALAGLEAAASATDRNATHHAEWANEDYEKNRRLTNLLHGETANGEWVPPQLEIRLENLSDLNSPTDSNESNSILRVHIYDKTAAKSDSLNAIMMAHRTASTTISGNGSPVAGAGNQGRRHLEGAQRSWNATLEAARSSDLLEQVQPNPVRYKIRGGFRELKKFVMNHSAYIIPGAQGSLVKSVSLSSRQDPNASIQLNSVPRPSEQINPNGSGDRGLPLTVMPVDVSMDMMGCPLITYTSNYFIDFNTNTMIDDIWFVSGITHKVSEGSFTTNVNFRPVQSYGRYRNYLNQLKDMEIALNVHETEGDSIREEHLSSVNEFEHSEAGHQQARDLATQEQRDRQASRRR